MHYIVGDVHGCFYTLQNLLNKITEQDSDPHLIFVGDYIDRGLHSKEVVDMVISLQESGAVCLRGNHDDILDQMLNGLCESNLVELLPTGYPPTPVNMASWWLYNGFGLTIKSYSDGDPFDLPLFLRSVPDSHKQFFRSLPLHWESDTHFACHAFVKPSEPLPRRLDFLPSSTKMDMLWSRYETEYDSGTGYGNSSPVGLKSRLPVWDRIGVFGHTPVSHYGRSEPIKHGNIRLIDTGACKGCGLTAYVCELDDFIFQATESKDFLKRT